MNTGNTDIFSKMPIRRAVLALVVPTVISQMVAVVYNMADTFFIGQTNDPRQVAAATIGLPLFVFLTALANLFGIGGASLMARSLGADDPQKARSAATFSVWTAIGVTFLYCVLIWAFRAAAFPLLGANADTYGFCEDYIFWAVTVGGLPTMLCAMFSHLVRAEGYSRHASFGVALGGILNIVLDPVFIMGFGMGVKGAAIATMLSNVAGLIYFLILLRKKNETMMIRLSPKYYSVKNGIPKEVVLVGLSSFILTMMSIVSNVVLNNLIASYSNEAIAGMGIAKKIDFLAFAIANGMTQGVLPLVAYNYASGDKKRMTGAIRTTLLYSLVIAAASLLVLYFCAAPITRAFIGDAQTVEYGRRFLRIICISCPFISVSYLIITVFQAMGCKVRSLLLSLLRKGCLDIPFMVFFHLQGNIFGIGWATPIADMISFVLALTLFVPYLRKVRI